MCTLMDRGTQIVQALYELCTAVRFLIGAENGLGRSKNLVIFPEALYICAYRFDFSSQFNPQYPNFRTEDTHHEQPRWEQE